MIKGEFDLIVMPLATRQKCPKITCHICEQRGHLSYDCTQDYEVPRMQPEKENLTTNTEEHDDNLTPTDPPTTNDQDMNLETPDHNTETGTPLDDAEMDTKTNTFDFLQSSTKQQFPADSDSDNPKPKPQQQQRIKPTPNIAAARIRKENKGIQDNSSTL